MNTNDASKPFAGKAPDSCVTARNNFRKIEPMLNRSFNNFSEYVRRENLQMPFSTFSDHIRRTQGKKGE